MANRKQSSPTSLAHTGQRYEGSATLRASNALDVVHGHQKLSEWNAHYDERCFLPIHIYDTATGQAPAVGV